MRAYPPRRQGGEAGRSWCQRVEVVHTNDARMPRVSTICLLRTSRAKQDLGRLKVREANVRGRNLEVNLVLVIGVQYLRHETMMGVRPCP